MEVGHADGEGIRGIVGRGFGESEHGPDHESNLLLLCAAASDDGLFDEAGGVFVDGKSPLGGHEQGDPAGGTEDDGGADVLHEDDTLDGEGVGVMGFGHLTQSVVDGEEAEVGGEFGWVRDDTVGDGAEFARRGLDDGVAGPA